MRAMIVMKRVRTTTFGGATIYFQQLLALLARFPPTIFKYLSKYISNIFQKIFPSTVQVGETQQGSLGSISPKSFQIFSQIFVQLYFKKITNYLIGRETQQSSLGSISQKSWTVWDPDLPQPATKLLIHHQVLQTITTLKDHLVEKGEAEYLLRGLVLVKACSKTLP